MLLFNEVQLCTVSERSTDNQANTINNREEILVKPFSLEAP